MKKPMPSPPSAATIRPFCAGEERVLRDIFYSSVHGVARTHYSPEQLSAWAPRECDMAAWSERIQRNRPFVAERDGVVVGFADLGADGYIDQFFVSEHAVGQGVGGALMRHIERQAIVLEIAKLSSHVSLCAQPFFRRFGFILIETQTVWIHGVALENGRMEKRLDGVSGRNM